MRFDVVKQPTEHQDHQRMADIDRVAEFADRLVQPMPRLEQERQGHQRGKQQHGQAVAHCGVDADREVQQRVGEQHAGAYFRQAVHAAGPRLEQRQQHLVR
ncbi:hypothetical protein D3C73_1144680 [compost metagenome]